MRLQIFSIKLPPACLGWARIRSDWNPGWELDFEADFHWMINRQRRGRRCPSASPPCSRSHSWIASWLEWEMVVYETSISGLRLPLQQTQTRPPSRKPTPSTPTISLLSPHLFHFYHPNHFTVIIPTISFLPPNPLTRITLSIPQPSPNTFHNHHPTHSTTINPRTRNHHPEHSTTPNFSSTI